LPPDRPLYGSLGRFVDAIAQWLRKGYPQGIPPTDYFPAPALLSRRLSDDEVREVARELIHHGDFERADIGVLITQCIDDLPTPEDIRRVQAQLAAWDELGA
jgi:hypothetical protein